MPDAPDRSPSLFRQIATTIAVLMAVFALVNAILVVAIYVGEQDQLARDVIRIEAENVLSRLDQGRRPTPPPGARAWRWAVIDPAGRTVDEGGDSTLSITQPGPPGDWTSMETRPGNGPLIAGVTKEARGGSDVRVSLILDARSSTVFRAALITELWEHVFLPLTPLVFLLFLVSLRQSRRLAAPMRAAADRADRLDPRRLDERLEAPPAPREVRRLVQAVNRALDRIEASTRLVRDFNANAAHELRTPLAVMGLAVDQLPPSEAKAGLREDIDAMSRTVTQMLELAQAEAMSGAGEPVDLAATAAESVAQMAPLAWAEGKDLILHSDGPIHIKGHGEAIARCLRNLLENALRHTAQGTSVEMTVGPGPVITVRDHGPGVPASERPLVFRRFWRSDRSRPDGAGLGLAIVQATMQVHGGEARIEDADGGGAVFVLDFAPEAGTPSPT